MYWNAFVQRSLKIVKPLRPVLTNLKTPRLLLSKAFCMNFTEAADHAASCDFKSKDYPVFTNAVKDAEEG
jgi:hypothetical protein